MLDASTMCICPVKDELKEAWDLERQSTGQLSRKELRDLKRMKMVKEALDELKRRGVDADIVICPNCKSPRVIDLTSYRDLGFLGTFQPAYLCLECGWYGRTLTIMTNRPEEDAVLEDMKGIFAPLMESREEDHFDEAPYEDL
ncbi:MAG: hypothetical protein ACE5H4_06025 [Candidatus Thorarchaeota archaeon]